MPTRRDFLRTGAAAGGALLAGLVPGLGCAAGTQRVPAPEAAPRPLRILILGGTGFIGPWQVRYAVSRGHAVSIFTRGRHEAELPASVEHLIGDRNGQLDALRGRTWDAVIDNSATNPDWVRQSATLLRDAVGQYVYISSTGVYYPYRTIGIDETTPVLLESPDPADHVYDYGVAKARSEREARAAFGDRATILRPHWIVGPGDTTDRYPYWPVRLAAGGEVLAPGTPDTPVQMIDVRDLTEWTIHLVERRTTGVFNASGPAATLGMRRFLEATRQAVGGDARLTWVDDLGFLAAHHVLAMTPWVIPQGNYLGMNRIRHERAIAAGLAYRPPERTAADTLAWWQTVPAARRSSPKWELPPAREAEVLAAWHARATG